MYKKILIYIFCNLISLNLASANFDIKARTAILLDYHSGEILFEKDADRKIFPASMTKIMTAIVAFDLLKAGEATLDEKVIISEKAWRMSQSGYSSMFIMLNDQVSVEDLLKGIIIVSGNDACVALAEGLSGTEEDFVILMNEKAEEIGLENTNFNNSSGINDSQNYSTVRDILKMSSYLIKEHPEFYEWFSIKEFTWNRTGGDPITQGNRNPLLYKNMGADGIKTGYLAVERYSLASSLVRKGRRLIAVGSGFETKNSRSKESSRLLTYGLTNFDLVEISKSKKPIDSVDVWLGKDNFVKVYTNEDIYRTIKKGQRKKLKIKMFYTGPIEAPIKKDQIVAKLRIIYDEEQIGEYDLLAIKEVKKVNIFSRLMKSLNYLIWGDV